MPRIRFDDLALRFVPGAGKPHVEALVTGMTNASSRVSRDGKLYSLRVALPHCDGLSLDRNWECAVLDVASAAGIGPRVVCCNPAAGVLVARWVTGRPWSEDEVRLTPNIDTMADLLRRVHSLKIPQPAQRRGPRAWIAQYADALARRAPRSSLRSVEFRSAVCARLGQLSPQEATAPVLCHSDLHRLNIMIGDRAILLDWEYAHVSDGLWDLAGWVANNDFTDIDADHLLASYLRRPVHAVETARLLAWVWLYDYVCLLWSELYVCQRRGPQSAEVLVRADILADRLRSRG